MAQDNPVVLLTFKNGTKLDETNYARFAEQHVRKSGGGGKGELAFPNLTTTKLRSIYSLIMNIYTKVNEPADFEKHKSDIQYLKVKMAYEAGREPVVKDFLSKTHLMITLDHIKTYEQFLLYCRYAESLVAYFKFYGGEDK
jgi:CRISPR-associated protein Csm2